MLSKKDICKGFEHKTLKERAEEFGGKIGPYFEPDYEDEVGREIWGNEYYCEEKV